jgi:septal ring factor EnvC (AmiA/AmiB activator)
MPMRVLRPVFRGLIARLGAVQPLITTASLLLVALLAFRLDVANQRFSETRDHVQQTSVTLGKAQKEVQEAHVEVSAIRTQLSDAIEANRSWLAELDRKVERLDAFEKGHGDDDDASIGPRDVRP